MRSPTHTGLVERRTDGGALVHRSPALEALGVPHAFTTRIGPGGAADLDAGELGVALVRELTGATRAERVVSLEQVHGADVHVAPAARDELAGHLPRADASVTDDPSACLAIRTADCVPILVATADGARVAAIHAGWRGLVAGVIGAALERLAGTGHLCAIGPCLQVERFEVGPEVAEEFRAAGLAEAVEERAGARPHVDLRAAAALELQRGGVARIEVASACTWDDARLWSHRRDVTHGGAARTGRLGALIAPALGAS
jgi:YfiH family protein